MNPSKGLKWLYDKLALNSLYWNIYYFRECNPLSCFFFNYYYNNFFKTNNAMTKNEKHFQTNDSTKTQPLIPVAPISLLELAVMLSVFLWDTLEETEVHLCSCCKKRTLGIPISKRFHIDCVNKVYHVPCESNINMLHTEGDRNGIS